MSAFYAALPNLVQDLEAEARLFTAGRLKSFLSQWKNLTSDPEILQLITGAKIEFDSKTKDFIQPSFSQPSLTGSEITAIDKEIEKLSQKAVISKCVFEPGQFVSPIFTRPKKDGSHRMILNLKHLNKEITHHHFKMDTLQSALRLITKGCFMASIDLKDAYYSVPVWQNHRKLLRFSWKGQLWQFNCLPNGISMAPRKFTKLLKPAFASLRETGHISSSFLDDSLLVAGNESDCMRNVSDTVTLFRSLGFVVHPEKSVLSPSQTIQYLGVIIDSKSMTVKLTNERKDKLKVGCSKLLKKSQVTIREAAQVIGMIVASFPAVKYGALQYRHLENDKKTALKDSKGNFDGVMCLSAPARGELLWWIDNIDCATNSVCD